MGWVLVWMVLYCQKVQWQKHYRSLRFAESVVRRKFRFRKKLMNISVTPHQWGGTCGSFTYTFLIAYENRKWCWVIKQRPSWGDLIFFLLGRLHSLGAWPTISFQVAIKHTNHKPIKKLYVKAPHLSPTRPRLPPLGGVTLWDLSSKSVGVTKRTAED